MHNPTLLQITPKAQVPQVPLQPSGPQARPTQFGVHPRDPDEEPDEAPVECPDEEPDEAPADCPDEEPDEAPEEDPDEAPDVALAPLRGEEPDVELALLPLVLPVPPASTVL